MFKALLKKQLMEVFRSYFYNAKKKKARTRGAVIVLFCLYALLVVGVLGGMFTFLAVTLCEPITAAGMDWLYFVLFFGIAVLLGAFGSVFSTYSGLYLSKDNDLLLSMPIPIRDIVASRLTNVFLMGAMYSGITILPALIVYWVSTHASLTVIICGIVLMLILFLFVLILSCLLGWCVARLSLKLKRKSFATTALSVAFLALYYFFYFKAQTLVENLVENVVYYGDILKDSAYGLYLFGRIGQGDVPATALFFGLVVLLLFLTWLILKRTFLSIATDTGTVTKVQYREKKQKQRSLFAALLAKEFARFTSSASYMLNCGLGLLIIPAAGIALLLKGGDLFPMTGIDPQAFSILLLAALCLTGSTSDMAAPSVSLEGKSVWILQSLPAGAGMVLRAKALFQFILCIFPMMFGYVCFAILMPMSLPLKLLFGLMVIVYTAFSALFATTVGILLPNLTWTNELTPIKQGASVAIALFGGFLFAFLFGGLYFLVQDFLSAAWYVTGSIVVFTAASVFLLKWLDTKGAEKFAAL